MSETRSKIDEQCINTIRTLSIDAIQKANSGHPGAPMGLAPAAYVLWTQYLKHNPKNPDWFNRDRFVLSGGHASMLLYSLLHLTGYDVSLDDIKNFRQWQSKTPGHPECGHTPGVETTTGPLGQGFANSVGMAISERHLASRFNRLKHDIIDHYTYVMCGDGDMMEGITYESASLAGHLGLDRLICLYDDNRITIEGSTDITFTEDVPARFIACNWHVVEVEDGNDLDAIGKAIEEAKAETQKPSLIILSTHIAYGSPNKQDSNEAHGAPLGEDEIRLTKKNLGWPENESFLVPENTLKVFRKCIENGEQIENKWKERFKQYTKAHPKTADELVNAISGFLPNDWDAKIPEFLPSDDPIATRKASGMVLNAIADSVPTLIGGSADLAPSNNTYINSSGELQKNNYNGRNIRFGVREHAMGSIMSGMFLHNGLRPYGGTFLVFSDYMRGAIRVASIMKLPVIYVFTHDSIAVGEDGPTHQPVEHIAALRAIPGLTVIRPADATETAEAWRQAIKKTDGPTALILSRQKLPVLNKEAADTDCGSGAYILSDSDGKPDVILIASGSEVFIAVEAKKELDAKGISTRVVSMPCWEFFEEKPESYKNRVLPPDVTARVAIEAGVPNGWEKYTGSGGVVIGINRFGASAPGGIVMKEFGFTTQNIVETTMNLVK
ncbi:MAG: transketolase [Desulfobacterales bacterium]|jgi:transketolase|nr:transketolase [Desulfobacteraceae bacterium]MBT4364326.1 transketolase [Desulfobacteraceae bacterium]MBT7085786.1 transketolase [Desulfobacterales bacterium]MBT7698088.1 transketolase [Desulfobacterales bacterium]